MTLYVPLPEGGWSGAVASGRVWVRNGSNWERVRAVSVRETSSWTQVYRWPGLGPALEAPTGSVSTFVASTEIRLVVSNRFETWRLQGSFTVSVSGTTISAGSVNVLADSYSIADPGVVNGTITFTVAYVNPDSGLTGPSATFSVSIGSEA
jgi:hypothetical protein